MGLMDMLKTSDPMAKFYTAAEKSNVPQGGITGKLFSSMFPHGLGNLAFGRNPEPLPPLETPEGTALMADLASNMMVPGTFIGPKGLARLFGDDAAKGMLATAESKLAQGVPKEAVFQELGVFKGPEGKWRYEIDDSGARIATKGDGYQGRLPSVLEHDDVFSAYPDARKVTASFQNLGSDSGRYSQPSAYTGEEVVSVNPYRGDNKSTLLHELQHAVQEREGFARGGSPQMFDPSKIADAVDANYALRKLYESVLDYKELAKKFGTDADAMFLDKYGYAPNLTIKGFAKDSKKAINEQIRRAVEAFDENAMMMGKSQQKLYEDLAGEAESRAVQDRIGMDMKTRRASFPDYANRNDLIIRGLMEPLGK